MNLNLKEKISVPRNYGIDLLRIISMFFICILHVLNLGGVTKNISGLLSNDIVIWLLLSAAYCAVNCYALISGYVSYGSKFKYSRIIYLYFQVIFYTVLITALFAVFKPGSVGVKDFIKAVFPFAFNTYWYFTSYFCVFFFIPFFNLFIEKASIALAKKFILTVLVVFSILPTVFMRDMFFANGGYSPVWLALLYLIGGFIKKYQLQTRISAKVAALGYFLCILVSWGSRFAIKALTEQIFGAARYEMMFISYVSPTILGAAIMLLIFSLKLHMSDFTSKIIAFFSPVAFGVYLIHTEPHIVKQFLDERFANYSYYSPVVLILAVIGTATIIWLTCSLIDKVRLEFFKLIRVKEFSIALENIVYKTIMKIKAIFNNKFFKPNL